MNINDNEKLPKELRANVRFSLKEYEKISKEANSQRTSIPKLLKNAYFSRLPTKVLMSHSDLEQVRADLNRIGNNINQVARKLNAGFMAGWSDTLDLVLIELKTLTRQLHNDFGVTKGELKNASK